MQKIIQSGSRAVSIHQNFDGGTVRARLYVNCQPNCTRGYQLGDATLINAKTQTLAGAERWAAKQLSA